MGGTSLAENIGRRPTARLLDWNGIANAHPEGFYQDGVHLNPTGRELNVDLIMKSVVG